MKTFWNKRYSQKEWSYGWQPNVYLKEKLTILPPGKILFPAEGEGRNAVFASTLGWDTSAFDYSEQGQLKAYELAKDLNTTIDYKLASFLEEDYPKESFDVICNIFVHFKPDIKTQMHQRLNTYLKKGGLFIMEVFSKDHLELSRKNPKVGGPDSTEPMYSLEEVKQLFPHFEIIELKKEKVHLQEGLYHVGESSVIRFVGRKL